ncbi:MAG: DUF2156 domain-containing protein [Gemmatimonadales bacterium]|nr:DUF2156 domain-containing protein [Gemmatimonadales bacterium]
MTGGARPHVSNDGRARALVLAHGWNATAYQILNPGIEHWFASAGDAVIGYVRAGGFRVVAGAPVCPAGRMAAVVKEFEREAHRARERVCYFGAEARLEATLAGSPDHSFVLLGAQPAWDPARWVERTGTRPTVRFQIRRAARKGVVISEVAPAAASSDPSLRECLTAWLATRGLSPLHFLVEPDTLATLTDRRIFVAHRAGRTIGFVVASIVPARRGWLVEQFIRHPDAPNGTMEALIDAAVRAVADDGAAYVTLGLSPLAPCPRADPPRQSGPSWWLRSLFYLMRRFGRRFYDFRGLERFKSKFAPMRWEPVYLITDQRRITLSAMYAVAAAFTGGAPLRAFARASLASLIPSCRQPGAARARVRSRPAGAPS